MSIYQRFWADEQGASLVEFAICLPLMTGLVFASITSANAIYVRQAVVVAAYESCRAGAETGGTTEDAIWAGEQVLNVRGVQGGKVTCNPASVEDAAKGEPVTVTIEVPAESNLMLDPVALFTNRNFSATVTMARE